MELVGIGRQGLNRFTFNGQSEKQANLADGKGYFYETDFRSYDATLGRFHAYDLMASGYSGITPYHFALNNPISANDPTGLEADSEEIKKKSANNSEGPKPNPKPFDPTRGMDSGGNAPGAPRKRSAGLAGNSNTKKPTSVEPIDPLKQAVAAANIEKPREIIFPDKWWDKDFHYEFQNDLMILYSTSLGKSLVRELHASKIKINITKSWYVSSSETIGDYPDKYTIKKGVVKLKYRGNSKMKIDGITAYSYIVLAHEFVHARDIANNYFEEIKTKYKLSIETMNEIAEVRAMIFENEIRKELGIKEIRTEYSGEKLLESDGKTPINNYRFDVTKNLLKRD